MKTVKLLKRAGGNNVGDEISVGEGQAQHLIKVGYAEAVAEMRPKRTTKKSAPKTEGDTVDATPGGVSPTEEATTAG